jgi:hypothetical protein
MSRGLLSNCIAILLLSRSGWCDDLDSRLGLADLAAYRAALSGKATATDAPAAEPVRPVSFRDLWDHPETWRGHRVQVRGKVARIFRQDAVGGFPALAEAWLSTPRGDLFCTVFPTGTVPELGQEVAFSGTFLRMVRYAGDDQPRIAPWIVGDRPPLVNSERGTRNAEWNRGWLELTAGKPQSPSRLFESWSPAGWMLGTALGLAGAGVLAWQHVQSRRPASPRGTRQKKKGSAAADPPLVFLETEPVNGTALPNARSH